MKFEFTQEQEDVRKAVREFATKEFLKEKAEEYDKKEEFPFEIWKKACDLSEFIFLRNTVAQGWDAWRT